MSAAAAVLPGITRSPIGCTTEAPSPTAFSTWCAKHSVLWPKCGMAVSAATGRCVVATEDIKEGEVVVEVPDDAVLMGENCQIQELLAEEGLLKPADDALLEVQGLILAVMYEKALGVKSTWAPYLAFLPSDMSHMPHCWPEDELEELRGTAAHDKMLGRVQHPADAPTRMRQLFEELVLPFVQSHSQARAVLLGRDKKKKLEELSEEQAREQLWPAYCWATAAVASYSFVLGDEQYQGMVPVWDLLNHITGAVNVRLHHDAARGVLQMIATQAIPQGAEVVNCYGNLSNAELLRGYGYVESHNSTQHVQIPSHFLIRAAAGTAAAAAADGEEGSAQQRKQGGASGEEAAAEADDSSDSQPADNDDSESGSDGNGDDGASSDDGDDGGASSDAESSSDDEEDEPDWDLEDDDPDLQKQQQQPAPSLWAAQQQIHDWEDRWQLCFSLKLLPKNGVLQVPGGGVDALPQQLLPLLLLMLADAGDCEKLSVAAAAVTSKAADAAAAAAAAAAARQAQKGSKSGKKQTKQQQKKKQKTQESDAAAAEAGADEQNDSNTPAAAAAAAELAAVSKELARIDRLQFCSEGRLHAALQLLVQLMQSRYSCSLAEDEAWLQQQQQQQAGGEDAAAAAPKATDCCNVAGCSRKHKHHHRHEHDHSHEHDKQQQQQQQQQEASAEGAAGGKNAAGKKRKQPEQQQQQQQPGKPGASKAAGKARKAADSKAAAAAGSAPGPSGFAFNFQM